MPDPTPTPEDHKAHGSYTADILTVENVELSVCQTCHFIEAHCLHVKNSWNAEGTVLTCDFCGIDGT